MSLADGSVIARLTDLPVEPQKTDIVYSGRKGRAWIWDIAIDKTVRLGCKVHDLGIQIVWGFQAAPAHTVHTCTYVCLHKNVKKE